jgi:hypothetical protein
LHVLDGELSIRCGGQFPPRAPAPVLDRWPSRLATADRRPCGIEDYFHQINTASTNDQCRIGERHGIHVVPRMSRRTRACPTCLVAAQNDPTWAISVEIQHESASVQSGGGVRDDRVSGR